MVAERGEETGLEEKKEEQKKNGRNARSSPTTRRLQVVEVLAVSGGRCAAGCRRQRVDHEGQEARAGGLEDDGRRLQNTVF